MCGAKRLWRPQAKKILRPMQPEVPGKMPRGFARYARSGWNRGVASWFAMFAVIICPARITIDRSAVSPENDRFAKYTEADMLCGSGPGCRRIR